MNNKIGKLLEKKKVDSETNKVAKPKQKIESHKYKCELGKKKYTFKTKKDLCNHLGVSNKKASKILGGEEDSKLKISLI